MKRKYLLKMRFANDRAFTQDDIIHMKEQLDIFSENAKRARNPKEITYSEYDEQEAAMVVHLESSIPLNAPGKSLAGFSRSLLTKYPEFQNAIRGTSLFKIETIEISDEFIPESLVISNCEMIKILVDLTLEAHDVKDRHKRDEVIDKVKKVLCKSDYVIEHYSEIRGE